MREKARMSGGGAEIRSEPTKVGRKPRNAESVPRATIRVGSRKPAMNRALTAPSAAPMRSAAGKMRHHGLPGQKASAALVAMYIAEIATAVKLTSMPSQDQHEHRADGEDSEHDRGPQQVARGRDGEEIRVRDRRHDAEQRDDGGDEGFVAGEERGHEAGFCARSSSETDPPSISWTIRPAFLTRMR